MTKRISPRLDWGMIVLGISAGALCGGLVAWAFVWVSVVTHLSSPWAVYRWYGLDSAAYGALFGGLIGPVSAAVRRKPWKAAVLGLAVSMVIFGGAFIWLWRGGAFRTLADVARAAATGLPPLWVAGAAIGWTTARVVAAVEGGWPLTAVQQRRVLLMTALVIVCAVALWQRDVYRQGTMARGTCERAARAFAAGDADTLLSMLPFMDQPGLNTGEIRQWFSMLRPFLPQGGQLIVEPPVTTKRGLCRCRGRVVGATYKVAPRVPGMEASFTVSVRKTPWGCKVYVLTEPVATYLASLYGDEAGLHWERWLQEHS